MFDEPDPIGGDRHNPADCLHHLLMVWACEYVEYSPTKFSQPGKPSDVIIVDVVDLDEADENGYQGAVYRRCWWRQARLIGALRNRIGKESPILAHMKRGTATMGQPPFELISATQDPDAVSRAQAWLKAHPEFEPSFRRGGSPPANVDPADPWRNSAPSPLEQQAQAATAAGGTDEYLARLARSQQEAASRLPPPPPQSEKAPF